MEVGKERLEPTNS